MRIDISVGLINFDGKPILEDQESQQPVTLKKTLIMACLNANPQTYNNGEKKYKVFCLLEKLSDAEAEIELTAEEVTLLKALTGDIYPVAVVGSVFNMLEHKE